MIGIILSTESGMWSPLALLSAAAVTLIIALLIRSTGTGKHKKGTEQTAPFFSGGRAPEKNIPTENLYWGFFESMKRYYSRFMRLHTGIVNDYVYCFVLLVVAVALALILGGMSWA